MKAGGRELTHTTKLSENTQYWAQRRQHLSDIVDADDGRTRHTSRVRAKDAINQLSSMWFIEAPPVPATCCSAANVLAAATGTAMLSGCCCCCCSQPSQLPSLACAAA